jgi:hypothetical protein
MKVYAIFYDSYYKHIRKDHIYATYALAEQALVKLIEEDSYYKDDWIEELVVYE